MQFKQVWKAYPMLAEQGGMMRLKSGGYSNSCLSDEGMRWTNLPIGTKDEIFPVCVTSKEYARKQQQETRRGLVYRVLVWCDCGRAVPFGKMGQHYNSTACHRGMKTYLDTAGRPATGYYYYPPDD